MENTAHITGKAADYVKTVGARLTFVYYYGKLQFTRKFKLARKNVLLNIPRRQIVVIIEPYLAYRNAFIIAAEQL